MTANVRRERLQQRVIAALLVSATIEQAAISVGLAERTVRRWLAEPGFQALYRQQAREASQNAVSAVLAAQQEAIAELRAQLRDGTPAARLRAATALLDLGVKVGSEDLDQRITELEQEAGRWAGQPLHAV